MSYEHDIFISYRHDCPTTPWMMSVFLRELKNRLIPARPEGISIFDDGQVRVGSTWPNVLHEKVTTSRLLLPILTPFYFGSEWCRKELALMMEREENLHLRTIGQSERTLVIPIRLWDGDKFPERLRSLVQLADFRGYTDVRRGTKKWNQFQEAMDALAIAIDGILDNIPDYDVSWLNLTGQAIEPHLRIPSPGQMTLLRLTSAIPTDGVADPLLDSNPEGT